jgi:hypothetical protein
MEMRTSDSMSLGLKKKEMGTARENAFSNSNCGRH